VSYRGPRSNEISTSSLGWANATGADWISFIRYSSLKSEDPTFTNNIGEHGYIYIKLIKLLGSHPLVKVDE